MSGYLKIWFAERRLALARDAYEKSQARTREALVAFDKAADHYAETRPLSLMERADIATYILQSGGAICHGVGVEWLKSRVPGPWAEALQHWAYEHLGCNPSKETRKLYVGMIEALQLDRFPK